MTRIRDAMRVSAVGALVALVGFVVAASLPQDGASIARAEELPLGGGERAFVRLDGVTGEADELNHLGWTEVVGLRWGAQLPRNRRGDLRRRASADVDDVEVTVEYDKAAPKLQEKCLKGAVAPVLEFEQTAAYGLLRETYLRYELTNVIVTRFDVRESDDGKTTVLDVALTFDEGTITYTQRDDDGVSLGNTEVSFSSD